MRSGLNLLLTALVFVAVPPLVYARNLDTYKESFESQRAKLEKEAGSVLKTAPKQYDKSLDDAIEQVKQQGDLNGVLAIRAEKERFARENSVPAETPAGTPKLLVRIQTAYREFVAAAENEKNRNMVKLLTSYMDTLNALKKNYVQGDDIDKALEVQKELERADFLLADATSLLPEKERAEPQPPAEPDRPATAKRSLPPGVNRDLMVFYSFDEKGGKAVNQAGDSSHGTIREANWVPDGKLGGALEFNGGKSVIEIGELNGLRDWTVCAWIRRNSKKEGFETLLASKNANSETAILGIRNADDRLGMRDTELYSENPIPKESDWMFIAATRSSRGMEIYVNGVKEAANRERRSLSGIFSVGARWWQEGEGFAGLIDEVMIWNRSLPDSEIRRVYSHQK